MGLFERIENAVQEIENQKLTTHKTGVPGVPGVPDSEISLDNGILTRNANQADACSRHSEPVFQVRVDDLFTCFLESIQSGGFYRKHWPNIENFCFRKFSGEQFRELQEAYSQGDRS